MADVWQYFQSLFQKTEQSSKTQPILHDAIVRSDTEIIDYEKWKNAFIKKQLITWIKQAYGNFLKEGKSRDSSILFLHTVSTKGFAIHFSQMNYTPIEVRHLFDYFKEKVLTLNYKVYNSDKRTYVKGEKVESTAKHYLKPSLKNMLGTPPFNQEFGNISIELICQDDMPKILKFSATVYNDRSYQKAKPFGQLMEHLLA